jgi:membrane protease YdiL (CAAX protease family)
MGAVPTRIEAVASRRRLVLLSPIVVVGLGFLLARVTGAIWGIWSWVPILVYYWAILGALIAWGGGREAVRRWLQPSRSRRLWVWRAVSLVLPVIFFITVFLTNIPGLNQLWIVVLWLALSFVNPWLEEGYWRGLLIDAGDKWPVWSAIAYSAFWFGASHPLVLAGGGGSEAVKGLGGFVGTFMVGIVWGVVYRQTRSLRWPIFGHFLQDLFAPPVLVFLNLLVIPGVTP